MDCLEDLENTFREFLVTNYPQWKDKLSEVIEDDEEFYDPIIYLEEENNVLIFEVEEDWCEITIHVPPIYHVHFVKEEEVTAEEWMKRVADYAEEIISGERVPLEFFRVISILDVVDDDLGSTENFDERVDLVVRLNGKDYLLEWMGGTDIPPEKTTLEELLLLRKDFSEKSDAALLNSFKDDNRFFILLENGEKIPLPKPPLPQ